MRYALLSFNPSLPDPLSTNNPKSFVRFARCTYSPRLIIIFDSKRFACSPSDAASGIVMHLLHSHLSVVFLCRLSQSLIDLRSFFVLGRFALNLGSLTRHVSLFLPLSEAAPFVIISALFPHPDSSFEQLSSESRFFMVSHTEND
jgi:hypothetical protein